jgi:predicted MPP superfamily phosphohydrolase
MEREANTVMLERELSRRRFLKLAASTTFSAALAGISGFVYSRDVEPGWLDVTSAHVELPQLAREFDGYRVVQISDIHADGSTMPSHLNEALRLVNSQAPDLCAITGDFVTSETLSKGSPKVALQWLTGWLRELDPRDGVVAVLGNHDHWVDAALVRRALKESCVIDLSNDALLLRRGEASLHIAGVDDVLEQKNRLDLVMERMKKPGAAILLAHEPDFADESAATGCFDLQISGHSHGGQVKIPIFGPPILPPLGRDYPAGFYQVKGMLLYTNRGLGMLPPRVRLNCRPEITVLTLRAPGSRQGQRDTSLA